MAEFDGVFCRPFLPSVLTIEGVGGMGGEAGWGGMGRGGVGGGKNYSLGHSAHTVANDTIVDHIVSGSKPRSPLLSWHPPWVPLFQL